MVGEDPTRMCKVSLINATRYSRTSTNEYTTGPTCQVGRIMTVLLLWHVMTTKSGFEILIVILLPLKYLMTRVLLSVSSLEFILQSFPSFCDFWFWRRCIQDRAAYPGLPP
jgi:hypothetical protein